MNNTQKILYAITIAFMVFGISTVVEMYKKALRKDKAKSWENCIAGLFLSALSVASLKFMNIFRPILGLLGAPEWADYLLYFFGIFFLQKQADMKLIKKLIKTCARGLLKTYGLPDDQIDAILTSTENKEK